MLTEKYRLPLLMAPRELFDDPKAGTHGVLRMSKSVFYARIRTGEIPQPIHIGKAARWSGTEIEKYLDTLLSKAA